MASPAPAPLPASVARRRQATLRPVPSSLFGSLAVPLLTFLAATVLSAQASTAAGEPPVSAEATAEARARLAQEGLASPLQRERQAAVRDLIELLPGARGRVLEAWRTGDEGVRATLTDVLAADGSNELLALALEAWRTGGDALAARARSALLVNPEATRRALAAFASRPAPPQPASTQPLERRTLVAIGGLLERDEVERLFLARKSRSGGTGSYPGQYAVLRPYRAMALEVCFHIVTDRAMRLPGTSAVGGYRFVRPPTQVLDVWEVRSMALNAILDLATADDVELVRRLDDYHTELGSRDAGSGEPGDGDIERKALMDDLLATLCRLAPDTYAGALRERVWELEMERRGTERREAAALALRAGWYAKAIELYTAQLAWSVAPALDHYNLACAYASWALQSSPAARVTRLNDALQHLELAVAKRWTDIAWMEEDKDLDPIRDTPRYRALKARIEVFIAGDAPLPEVPAPRRRR